MGRSLYFGSQHDANKLVNFSIGRSDGSISTIDLTFTGMKCQVLDNLTAQESTANNHSQIGFYTWGNALSNSREVMRLDSRGRVRLMNDVWHLTLSDSKNRFCFTPNGATYFGSPGNGFIFQGSNNTNILTIGNDGAVTTTGTINSGAITTTGITCK